ncbi:MAG: hypothetical protein IKX86_01365 [Clostridia bacterium]|nr:hypothetical protein [Clostridia bacterium]
MKNKVPTHTIIRISAAALVFAALVGALYASKDFSGRAAETEPVVSLPPGVCGHEFVTGSYTAPTCTEPGRRVLVCRLCGESTTETIPAAGHDMEATVIPPTCTTGGVTVISCKKCGVSEFTDRTEPVSHEFEESGKTDPTCSKPGYTVYTCRLCGAERKEEYTPRLWHAYTATATGSARSRGGEVDAVCTRCGATAKLTIKVPSGHTVGELTVTTAPTCSDEGLYTFYCSHCKKEQSGKVEPVDHVYLSRTCYVPYICMWCGNFVGQSMGHRYGEGFWVWKDENDEGIKRYHCTVCGEDRDFEICRSYPEEIIDTPIMRALEYIGYDVQGLIRDGLLFSAYGENWLAKQYRSNVLYSIPMNASPSGANTVADSSTVTGLAPNLDLFRKKGLICASFNAYYLLNYLPNIEGYNVNNLQKCFSYYTSGGYNLKAVKTWQLALKLGTGSLYGRPVELIGKSFDDVDREKLAPGDIIIFRSGSGTPNAHCAIYVATWKGKDFVAHCTYPQGVDLTTVEEIGDPWNNDHVGAQVSAIYHIKVTGDKK